MNSSFAVAAVVFVLVLGSSTGYLGGTLNSVTNTVTDISITITTATITATPVTTLTTTTNPATTTTTVITTTITTAGQPSPLKSFIVMVTSSGFNNGTLNLNVTQGDTIQITFAMDASQRSDGSSGNYHTFEVIGYNVTSAEMSATHPNVTITFLADKVGTFSIVCTFPPCPIHPLMLNGRIHVEAPG